MTGRLLAGSPPSPPLPHVHLVFQLEGGLELLFQDTRRFGQVLVFPPGVAPPPLAQVGAEPFSRKVTPAWLAEQARGRSRPIKNFLLDARILAGIGNIYACEILFAAGLHPATPVGRLTLADWGRVLTETRRILKHAIRKGGTTVSNYLNSKGEAGLFQLELLAYGRAGEPCRCGARIHRLVQAGRSTFFCPACQPLRDCEALTPCQGIKLFSGLPPYLGANRVFHYNKGSDQRRSFRQGFRSVSGALRPVCLRDTGTPSNPR